MPFSVARPVSSYFVLRATSRRSHDLTLLTTFDNDVLELLFPRQAALHRDRQLEGHVGPCRDRRLTDAAGGDLDVLLLDRPNHVAGGHLQRGQLVRVQPDPHAVIARSQEGHIADTLEARQVILDVEQREVAQVQLIVAAVRWRSN